MKKLLLAAAAIVGLLVSNATAQANGDKYLAPTPAPTPVGGPCAFFGGLYVGAHAGANLYRADRNDDDAYLTDNAGHARTDEAFLGGIQAGYNVQRGCTIFGIEGDAGWTSAEGDFNDNPNAPAVQGIDAEMDSIYTLRARSGVVVNNLMLYATGGLAAAKIKNTYFEDTPVESFSFSDTRWGFALGAGAEYALSERWSLKTEALYLRFEEDTESFTNTNGTDFQFTTNDSAWVGRLGLNYRFGGEMHRATGSKSLTPAVTASAGPCAFFGGLFIGVSGGGAYYRADRNDDDGFLTDNAGHTRTDDAGIIGAQAGYNLQRGCTIFGVEAGGNWTSAEATFEDDPNDPGDVNGINTEIDSIYTLRTKSGVVVDNLFIYATGGLASAEIKSNYFDNPPPTHPFSDRRWGWVAGLGTEWALGGRWSLKAEGLYMQFEEETDTFTDDDFQFTANDSIWVARAGLNYRLGGADHGSFRSDGSKSFKPAAMPSAGPCAFFGGFYVGAHGAAVRYRADRNDDDGFLTDNAGHARTNEDLGGGIQAGYNVQRDCNIFGIEADGTWGDVQATFEDDPNDPGDNNGIDAQIDSIYTLRAKTGVVVDKLAMYVTGGLAAADIKSTYFDNPPPSFSFSDTRWGWTAGIGTEWAFADRWSLKSEALYMQFEEQTNTFTDAGTDFQFTDNDSVWVARIGLNYKFGGGRSEAPIPSAGPLK